ncbi:neutral/alkaline non-lysosomal ceramidase N-terminal domain-containing protein [Opitutales bacterium]|nr:neutral/alkaline non-lysosomal ceramidase N-terminal domain-containing protein [Opitutales bacterium]
MNLLFRLIFLVCALSVSIGQIHASLRAGAASSNITPHLGIALDGTISINGPAVEVHDELHARCLVLDDGEQRLAIVVCDNTMIDRSILDRAKQLVEERCGLPANRILISATHSHAAPRVVPGLHSNPLNHDYETFLVRRIADGVQQAIANLSPAQIGWAQFDKPEFVHNRRWFIEEGSKLGNPFGKSGDQVKMNARGEGLVKPAGPVDPEVFILSVQHPDGRPMALLANYGTHYVGGYERGHISADYFGLFSKRMETLLGENDPRSDRPPFVAMMSNGTSGDVRSSDLGKSNPVAPWELMNIVAESIAKDVFSTYPDIKHREDASLDMTEAKHSLGVRKPSAKQIAWAERVWDNYQNNPDQKFGGSTNPIVYARETLALADYPDKREIILQAIRIGDLSIVSSPCETFAETGLAIKRRSPFKDTFTIELANGADGYLPTIEQHGYGGYETWPARSSLLEVTAERKIRSTLLDMLNQLKAEQ